MRFYKRQYHEYFWQCYSNIAKFSKKNEYEIALEAFEEFSKKYPNNESFDDFFEYVRDQSNDPSSCDICGEFNHKMIYMGAPMKICANDDCRNLSGFWSWIPLIHFDGHIMIYTGDYLGALKDWLTQPIDDNPREF